MWYPEIGEEFPLPESTWMKVANPDGIRNINSKYEFGDTGLVEKGGILTVMAIDTRHEVILVTYQRPKSLAPAAGSVLPTGTLFLFPVSVVAEWESLENCVRRLLKEQSRSVS